MSAPSGPPFAARSATSRAAADSIASNASALRAHVFALLDAEGDRGLTDEEIQDLLNIGGNTERPRRRELEKAGHVRDSGRTRKTRSGREATVWVVVRPEPSQIPLPLGGEP